MHIGPGSGRGSGLLQQLVPHFKAAMVPRIKIRQLTTSARPSTPNMSFYPSTRFNVEHPLPGVEHLKIRQTPSRNLSTRPVHNHDDTRISDSEIIERAEAKIKNLKIPVKPKKRREDMRRSRKERADLLARLTIDMDMRGRRLPSQLSPFISDLKILQQYMSDWKYGMALHIGEDPTSTGPEMRRIVKERISSALSEIDKIVSEAREMSKELRKNSKFVDLIDQREGNAGNTLQSWAKGEAKAFEKEHALEDPKPAVESTTRSEFNKFLEYLAMEHKPESPDSEPASLDSAPPSQALERQEPAVENTLDSPDNEPAIQTDAQAAPSHEAREDRI
jgi:hypothetical protein